MYGKDIIAVVVILCCCHSANAAKVRAYYNIPLRQERQVVQPKWLPSPKAIDTTAKDVKITKQNLQEAAAIRASIQKAIDEGQFAVDTTGDGSYTPPVNADLTMFAWPQWKWQWPAPVYPPVSSFLLPQQQAFHQNWLSFLQKLYDT